MAPPPGMAPPPKGTNLDLRPPPSNGHPSSSTRSLEKAVCEPNHARALPDAARGFEEGLGQARAQGAARAKLMERLADTEAVRYPGLTIL